MEKNTELMSIEEIREKAKNMEISAIQQNMEFAVSEIKPSIDKNKTLYENAKDFAKTGGLVDALKDEDFRQENKESAKENLRVDLQTENISSKSKLANEYYNERKPVLKFMRQKEYCDIQLMKWLYRVGVVPFFIVAVIGSVFSIIGALFEGLNELFNMIFGEQVYLKDNNGNLSKDEHGKPIIETVKVNLLTKVLFGSILVFAALMILFSMIKSIFNIDILNTLKTLF